ncbi:MAG: Uma2 family endonuclease [Blastocatellia bacterium]
MPETLTEKPYDLKEIVSKLVTEDDEPVDNIFSAKQQRLLVEPLYSSWMPEPDEDHPAPRTFLADANVGVFYSVRQPPLVPDMFLSLDVEVNKDWHAKENRSYMIWEFGKVPEVVVEVVSNREGNELGSKVRRYAEMGINYYIVFDPMQELSEQVLRIFEISSGKSYRLRDDFVLPTVGLSVTLWRAVYEGVPETWLRWCDKAGTIIPTGAERAAREAERANQEAERANQEAERAAREAERAKQEAERADRAEAELARLREELEQLRRSSK